MNITRVLETAIATDAFARGEADAGAVAEDVVAALGIVEWNLVCLDCNRWAAADDGEHSILHRSDCLRPGAVMTYRLKALEDE